MPQASLGSIRSLISGVHLLVHVLKFAPVVTIDCFPCCTIFDTLMLLTSFLRDNCFFILMITPYPAAILFPISKSIIKLQFNLILTSKTLLNLLT